MKKFTLFLLVFALAGTVVFAGGDQEKSGSKADKAKVIGYYMDAADDYYKAGYQVFNALAEEEGWEVIDIVGQGTAPEQITAVENFITQKVDALIVVQNSPRPLLSV